jgi:hypothetical protein
MSETKNQLTCDKPETTPDDVVSAMKQIENDRPMDPNTPNAAGYMGSTTPLFLRGGGVRWAIIMAALFILILVLAAIFR